MPRAAAAPPRAAAALLLMVAALTPVALGCSSFLVNCPDADGAVVTVRTLDFSSDLTAYTNITLFPKALEFEGLSIQEGQAPPKWQFNHTFVASTIGATLELDGPATPWDGMNDAGLAVGWLWQSNVTFHNRYNASGPSEAIVITDVPYYILGKFSTVQEVREWLNPDELQIVTKARFPFLSARMPDRHCLVFNHPKVREMLTTVFSSDPDILKPDDDGTLFVGLHLHITDALGDGLLLEATRDGGWATYDTPVLTNEPSFPDMQAWMAAYKKYDFNSVPGIANAPAVPWVKPELIPFNSANDAKDTGYFGSQSRFLRLSMQSENCSSWAWPNATWSPNGASGGGDPQDLALKRAQNWLGSVAVPVGVLGQKSPTAILYATQLAFLKDQTGAVYYYNSPTNNGWLKIDVGALSDAREGTWFPVAAAAPAIPFATDVTGGAASI
ncbi:hypothetical protein COHA_001309 [Chlorella ohadii]|uniref:Choloylglycine hydrolase/NAAA C-terminal domain-containing protein n=1 Tax=Chlorella ohadii TaxID=2649997 RepID=A0AAD5DVP1_9CHLO|nr:hypothetical protein COHA_001309 [Chlorella ohadii]